MSNRMPPADLVIRSAEWADIQSLCELDRITLLTRWSPEMYKGLMADRRSDLRIACIGERPIGFHATTRVYPDIELLKIAVRPEFQGTGVGRALLEDAIATVHDRSYSSCFLEVRASNARAIRFYRGKGFEVVGVRRAYYRDPVEDALVMRKELRLKAEDLSMKDTNEHE